MKRIVSFAFVFLFMIVLAFAVAAPVSAQICDSATDPTCVSTQEEAPGVDTVDPGDPAPTPTDFVLPSYVEVILAAVVGFLVTQGFKGLGMPIGDMSAKVTAAVTIAVVAFVNSLLALVPDAAQPSVGILFLLISTILSGFGIHYTIKNKPEAKPEPKKAAV